MKNTFLNEQSRRLRTLPMELVMSAEWQCRGWLDQVKRITTGIYHYRDVRVRPGQWVRFIGNPEEVQGGGRVPQIGSYGQVWRRIPGWHRLYVVFLGSTFLFRMLPGELEPLVGTPVGRPRDHLRFVKRRLVSHWRSLRASKDGGQ
jgi:hypothetical protein